jgi:hypothetical protein
MTSSIETLAKEMSRSAGIVKVQVRLAAEDASGMRVFLAFLSAEISKASAIWLCRDWAELIRKVLPDRPDAYSAAISVILPLGRTLGVYCIGRIGHEDVWTEDEEDDASYMQAWDSLYQRLDDYLRIYGKSDWDGNGDYYLFDENSGNPEQFLTIFRIEFLTPDLVRGIQGILADGFANWSVFATLDLMPPVEGIGSARIEIFADRIVEEWDRALLTEVLGERLKL